MSILEDVFKIGTALLTAASNADRRQKLEVAQHFQNLADVYLAFAPAHKANNKDQVAFLLAKTQSLLQSIEGSILFENVLGAEKAKAFFEAARKVVNEKDALSKTELHVAEYKSIAVAAGYLEGYAESLRAQAGEK